MRGKIGPFDRMLESVPQGPFSASQPLEQS